MSELDAIFLGFLQGSLSVVVATPPLREDRQFLHDNNYEGRINSLRAQSGSC